LYRSLNIVGVIKSRRLRWTGHVARKEQGRRVREGDKVNVEEGARVPYKAFYRN
jgi:hypothetical protein